MDHLRDAKRNIIAAQSIRADAEAEPVAVLMALSQTATANALVALVERLDMLTDEDSQAIRTIQLR